MILCLLLFYLNLIRSKHIPKENPRDIKRLGEKDRVNYYIKLINKIPEQSVPILNGFVLLNNILL